MITLIVGEVPLLQRRVLESLKKEISNTEMEHFYGGDADISSIIGSCANLSLFGGNRLVVLRKAEQLSKEEQEKLLKYLEKIPQGVQLVLMADKIDRRTNFWKGIQKKARIMTADPPPARERRQWLQQEWRLRGKTIAADALEALAELTQEDFLQGLQAIERIDLYLGEGNKVDLKTVDCCLTASSTAKIFTLAQALGSKDWDRAFLILVRLWSHHENPNRILALIIRQFRLLLKAKECESRRKEKGHVAAVLGVPPYFVEDYFQQAASFGQEELIHFWTEFRKADEQLKSTPGNKEWVLEELLLKLRSERVQTAVQA